MPFTHATRVQIPSGSFNQVIRIEREALSGEPPSAVEAEMRRDAAGQDRDVVSPFEDADDPPLGVRLGDVRRSPWSVDEVLDFESEVAHGILRVGVESRADQDKLGLELIRQRLQSRTKRGEVSSLGVP